MSTPLNTFDDLAVAYNFDGRIYPKHHSPSAVPDGAAIHLPAIADVYDPRYRGLFVAAPRLFRACENLVKAASKYGPQVSRELQDAIYEATAATAQALRI